MLQQGQVFKLRSDTEEKSLWAYRYRVGGRGSRRVQRGGFASERDASEALERALERVRRERGCGTALTLAELVDEYLAQHDGEPETIEKLSWLLTKAVKAFGTRRLPQLRSQEIAAWRMTIPPGHRFEATQNVDDSDVRHLTWLANQIGGDLLDAIIITTGDEAYRRRDGIAVIPAALLGP